MEPIKIATFAIAPDASEAIFVNDSDKDGYVKASSRGESAQVGTVSRLAVDHATPVAHRFTGHVSGQLCFY